MSTPCRRCHRPLKDPESIKIGLGPRCLEILAGKRQRKRKKKAVDIWDQQLLPGFDNVLCVWYTTHMNRQISIPSCLVAARVFDASHAVCRSCERQNGPCPQRGPDAGEPKESKYRNQRITVDGETFDSKREFQRYQELRMLEKAGKISGLRRQVAFELAPAVVIGKRKRPALRYIADYVYRENGEQVVEDVKGIRTEGYRIKRHLMATVHGIAIKET